MVLHDVQLEQVVELGLVGALVAVEEPALVVLGDVAGEVVLAPVLFVTILPMEGSFNQLINQLKFDCPYTCAKNRT